MATVEMGSKIAAAGPVIGTDDSKLVEPFAEKGALQRLPAVERAFKEARAAIEAAEVQPFMPEEKHQLHDRSPRSCIQDEQTRDCEGRQDGAGRPGTRGRKDCRERAARGVCASDGRCAVGDGRTPSRIVAISEVLMATQAVADQQLIQTLAGGELEDFAANVLMTEHSTYISRVFPLAIQRAEALAAKERKANPNKIGVSEAHAKATRLADEWKRWRQANPTPAEKRRAIRERPIPASAVAGIGTVCCPSLWIRGKRADLPSHRIAHTHVEQTDMVMGLSKEVERQLAAYPAAAVEKWFGLYSQLGELRVGTTGNAAGTNLTSFLPSSRRLLRRREGLDRGRMGTSIPRITNRRHHRHRNELVQRLVERRPSQMP